MIERLAFDRTQPFNAIEAASHLARYTTARRFCRGQRVLDIACGQGYGSFFLKSRWGAATVDAVDVSPEAIASAKKLFGTHGVRHHCRAAEQIGELFEPHSFDLIVCLETIEHVEDAEVLLKVLQRHLAPDGTLILSCPNDYWYYPALGSGNPFHVRKFRFDEFRSLTESVFGPAAAFLFGAPISGFANFPADDPRLRPGAGEPTPLAMTKVAELADADVLPSDEAVGERNCSYFVGIWSPAAPPAAPENAVVFPCSMNASAPASEAEAIANLREEVVSARTSLFEVESNTSWLKQQIDQRESIEREVRAALAERDDQLASAQDAVEHQRRQVADCQRIAAEQFESFDRELRAVGLRAAAFHHENEFVKHELRDVRWRFEQQQAQLDQRQKLCDERGQTIESLQAQLAACVARLERIRGLVPAWMRRGMKTILRWR
jgi:SAM-dependent methyltransferase